jgi:Lipoprotein LpqB beta-propeller domain/Sporulation and spore germination
MRDPRAARPRRPRGLTALVTGLVAAAVVTSGCSVIPVSNSPQPATAPAPPAGAGPCCGLLVRGPQVGWSPQTVVQYFLLASAIGAHHYAAARQYLTKGASNAWRPGSAVTILTQEPKLAVGPGRVNGPVTKSYVVASGTEQARLNSAGQYIAASGGVTAPNEEFVLQYGKGLWKISQLSTGSGKVSHELLLTSDLFHLEYTPRNLYYYGGRNGKLVPYPVFVPIQGTNPAVTLINDLIAGPGPWLAGGAQSAFPPESHLVQPIQVFPGPSGGRTAVVNIAVPPQPTGLDVPAMAAQLVTTLTSAVYSTPLFRAVKLKINGRPWSPTHTGDTLSLSTYQRDIPQWPAGEKAYYLSQGGSLRSLTAKRGSAVLRGKGNAPVTLSRIAVSPGGNHLAGLAGPANAVYTGKLVIAPGGRQSLTQLHAQFPGFKCTSLSWDRLGDLWVTGANKTGAGVWVLPGGVGPAVAVTPSADSGRITDLQVAPDGDRVAMIAGTGDHAHLVLAAIIHEHAGFLLSTPAPLRPSLPPVSALTWYDEDHLLVVTGTAEQSQLWEVPLDGDNPVSLTRQPGILTVTAAGPGNPMYLGFAGDRLQEAGGPNQPLTDIPAGQAIIYPG